MPPDLDVALLKLTSGDTRCMTLSVQNLTCPVYDLDTNVLFEGMWQVLFYFGGPLALSYTRDHLVCVTRSKTSTCTNQ